MNKKVLLTDGELTNTLAAVRCLGKHRDITVYVTSQTKYPLSSFSKYCKGCFILPNPLNEVKYVNKLVSLLKKKNFDTLIPIGFHSERTIIKNKKKIEKFVLIPTVNYKSFEIASRKDKTVEFAKRLGVLVPDTYRISKLNDLNKIKKFPVVIKATEGWGTTRYAANKKELRIKFKEVIKNDVYHSSLPIIQEYIPGNNGFGFYALYNKGKLLCYYMHKRIHMYPRSGGASTMAATYYNAELYKTGKKILDKLKWHGVAMVEFKKSDVDNRFYLIEINPKYWGSLDLGIAAGIEIPYYHVMLSLGEKVKCKKYKRNIIFRWPSRDFLYAISGKNKIIEIFKWFMLFLNFRIKDNILLEDFIPTIYQLKDGIKKIKNRVK